MVQRIINPLKSNSFFLFGARGVGKTTYLHSEFSRNSCFIDLLDDEQFDLYLTAPKRLEHLCESSAYEWIIVDEVQRLPKLLNSIHRMIEKKKQKFILTGSSSRKLKKKGANLLAGRAFVYTLHPFTYLEQKNSFDLTHHISWGSLPKISELTDEREKKTYLRSYIHTYLKSEIMAEQAVKNLEPFREFLEVAAQMSGKILNFEKIAREVGVQNHTIQNYFSILEDTYLGFYLPHFHRSIRKSQIVAPKFYLFDNGVKRSLDGTIESVPSSGTTQFGDLFESFIVQEIFRLNLYFETDYRLAYFHTKHNAEIDLVLTKGKKTIAIEIKSGIRIDEQEVKKMNALTEDLGSGRQSYYLSQDPAEFVIEGISCLPWYRFLENFEKFVS